MGNIENKKKDLIYVEKVIKSCFRMMKKESLTGGLIQGILREFILKRKTLMEEVNKGRV